MRILIEATTAAVAVSTATSVQTKPGFPLAVSAVGLADGDSIAVYKWTGSAWVAAVDRATPAAITLTFAAPDCALVGGPIYGFSKGSTTGTAGVIAWP